ncbi:D-xylose 1-dehydrogenase Gfo6 [Halorhabdus sp. CUG00001]|uniref:D-xylose 1-dehydrogenase Gfo6 n=1 Tax=Halorhabdus sp. CUG00001 TaxID=2600297 RepID=UPI00131E5AC0|nr:D-xylose 1-dehydrogenase Gfo6 [Halorhabdus sp. CUG00001]
MTVLDTLDDFARRDWAAYDGDGIVRIALIGAGWFTREWALPGFERAAHTDPTVVVDTRPERADRLADEYGLTSLTPEQFHDGTARAEYDAVYVCTPNATHLAYVERAAGFGKDILCEKPMEANRDRAAPLVETAAAAGVTLMIGYRMHTDPVVRRARELIDGGAIGEVVQIHGNMSQRMLAELEGDPADQWRLDPDLAGGGAMMDIGIYPLNTTRFLLSADPVRVSASTAAVHDAFDAVEEQVAVRATFEGEVPVVFTASHAAYHDSFLRVTGTEGVIVLDPAFFEREDRDMAVRIDGEGVDVDVTNVHQLEEEFAYFADCLLSGREPYPDGEHGLVDMRAIEAIYESAQTGETVRIENAVV